MIEHLTDLPPGCIGMRVVGEFTVDDFAEHVEPSVDEVVEQRERLRLVLHLGVAFTGFGPGAWGQLTDDLRRIPFHRGAVVTDDSYVSGAVNVLKWTLRGHVRTFRNREFDAAVEWVQG